MSWLLVALCKQEDGGSEEAQTLKTVYDVLQ